MASQTTNYQCPACTGPLHFVGSSGRLECDYCGSSYSVEEIEKLYGTQNTAAAAAFQAAPKQDDDSSEWGSVNMQAWNAGGMKAYNCTSCGAELICDENTAATECPYCGNPTIIPGQLNGALKPELIIPFKLDKQAAMDALRRHYGKKKLLPKLFTEDNHVQKIQGVYVPFWLYSGSAEAGANFSAQRIFVHREGDNEVTETSFYELYRSGIVDFENIPVDASSKMSDDLMDSLEPYDYSELRPFSMSYLPGFLADKFDMTSEECAERADRRAKNTVTDVLRRTTDGYVNVSVKSSDINLRRGKVRYALMPVWLLNTKWGDKNYVFAMNGQTGKFIGDLPTDKKLYWKWHMIYTAVIGLVSFAVMAASKLL